MGVKCLLCSVRRLHSNLFFPGAALFKRKLFLSNKLADIFHVHFASLPTARVTWGVCFLFCINCLLRIFIVLRNILVLTVSSTIFSVYPHKSSPASTHDIQNRFIKYIQHRYLKLTQFQSEWGAAGWGWGLGLMVYLMLSRWTTGTQIMTNKRLIGVYIFV